jgi:hypothetical protein
MIPAVNQSQPAKNMGSTVLALIVVMYQGNTTKEKITEPGL